MNWIEDEDRFEIPDRYMGKWSEAFLSLDIRAQVSQAESWYVSNPGKRKKDHARFLNNWLSRAQRDAQQGRGSSRWNSDGVPDYVEQDEEEEVLAR